MLYRDTVEATAAIALKKARFLRERPGGYLLGSMLAGAYVGLAIILIFSLGAPLAAANDPMRSALMGASFGIALSLVIIGGAELFTGNNLTMVCGLWLGQTTARDLVDIWVVSWIGNLLGSVLLAAMVWLSGAAVTKASTFVTTVALAKVSAPFWPLFLKAVLCNWLVCLAVWTSIRATSEAAKLIMIFWCLFAFIGSGFEHSVANMTLLTLAMLMPATEGLTWSACAYNIIVVTLGNIVGGAVMVGGVYSFASCPRVPRPQRTGVKDACVAS